MAWKYRMLALLVCVSSISGQTATDLIISEYVEGSSLNKAIELYNGTGAAVDLSRYALRSQINGSESFSTREALSGSLAPGGTLVLADDSADAEILAVADVLLPSSPLNFNGDDVVALFKDDSPIDYIGVSGVVWGSDVTLRRKAVVASPNLSYTAEEWETFPRDAFEDLGRHGFSGPLPEPSGHATDFTATLEETRIHLAWKDATGGQLPENYVVFASSNGQPPIPVDGTEIIQDADQDDGRGAYIVEYGAEALTIKGIKGSTTYTFRIVPFTNTGAATDYRTVEAGPTVSVNTETFVLRQPFATLGEWTSVNLGAASQWKLFEGAAVANASAGSAGSGTSSDDWLISAPIDFTGASDLVLNFDSRTASHDSGGDRGLTVYFSTDYDGSATPASVTDANWQELSPMLPDSGSDVWSNSGNVPLPAVSGTGHIAFRHRANGTSPETAETWAVDNVYVFSSDNVLPALTLSLSPASVEVGSGVEAIELVVSVEEIQSTTLAIALSIDRENMLAIPPVMHIEAGSRTATVLIGPLGTLSLEAPASVTIRGMADGFLADTVNVEIIPEPARFLTLTLADSKISENAGNSATTGTIMLSRAPIAYPVSVSLTVDDATEASVPPSVAITSSDGLEKSFPIAAVADDFYDPDADVTLTATATDYGSDTASLVVTNSDPRPGLTLLIEPDGITEAGSATGTIFLSEVARSPVNISLITPDNSEATAPENVFIPAGAQVGTFSVNGVDDGIVDGNQTTTLIASAPGWGSAHGNLEIRDLDVARTIFMRSRQAALAEGESTVVDVTLSVPTEGGLTMTLRGSGDLSMNTSLTLPAGARSGSFPVTAIAGDGYEGLEAVELLATADGYLSGTTRIEILDRDPQLTWLQPATGAQFNVGEPIPMRVEVADPHGSVEAVVFLVDGVEIARDPVAPYTAEQPTEMAGTLTLAAFIRRADGTASPAIECVVTVRYSPPRVPDHFLSQTLTDFFGAEGPTEARMNLYRGILEREGREGVLKALLQEPQSRAKLRAIETMLLLYNRPPSMTELLVDDLIEAGVDGLGEGEAVPAMKDVVEAGPAFFFDAATIYPGGIRGLAHVLQKREEARIHFHPQPAALTNGEFFEVLWLNRHGEEPSAQQIVQAHNRIVAFGREREDLYAAMDEQAYGRVRFIESLILREQFDGSTDVIFDPPNRHSTDDAVTALLLMTLWQDGGAAGGGFPDRAALAEWRAMDLAGRIRAFLDHPNYWDRFGYSWLGATRDTGEPDWRKSAWFGWFYYRPQFWPWIFHLDHEWIYASNDDAAGAGIWYYDRALGWTWTNETTYPWIYRSEAENWYYYHLDSRNPRWFYSAAEGAWVEK